MALGDAADVEGQVEADDGRVALEGKTEEDVVDELAARCAARSPRRSRSALSVASSAARQGLRVVEEPLLEEGRPLAELVGADAKLLGGVNRGLRVEGQREVRGLDLDALRHHCCPPVFCLGALAA